MARTIILLFLIFQMTVCGEATVVDWAAGDSVFPLPNESKGDNYISTNAREYMLSGTAHADLPEGYDALTDEDKATQLEQAVASRMAIVVRSIKSHIDKVIREANGGTASTKDSFFIYIKRGAGQSQNINISADNRIQFNFELELIGNMYLMSKVAPGSSELRTFQVKVVQYTGQPNGEEVTVTMKGSESRDAFPRYNELFDDDVLDIAIHLGGDYNTGRHDLETVKWLLKSLKDGGWNNGFVTDFDSLKIDLLPFTRTVKVEGRDIEVRVSIIHSDMVEATEEEKLSDAMKSSLATADIVVYSGHAGAGAGFILDYQPRHEIKAAEFETLELASKYQIYVFDGCNTYRTYVDDILKNPAKNWDNLDIMTTVNTTPFGAGYQVIWELIHWFTITNDAGAHFPLSWQSILRGINIRYFKDVHYGVHGIDNNPRLNPHGGHDMLCQPCRADGECGPGGNLCLGYGEGAACGVACTTDTACPNGYRCARLTDDPDLFYLPKQCVQRDLLCR